MKTYGQYNTIVTSEEHKTLEDIANRCPIDCIELEPGRVAFLDDESGRGREWFADELGYMCESYEAFNFEYLDEVQEKKPNYYTANGWTGSNFDRKLSTKVIAAKIRAFARKNFPGFKLSICSEWSMYTDSITIELKAGLCLPFIEGSRSSKIGYMSTTSTVEGWENELTPEIFKVLDAVTTYANSFRYDDSDGMQDYFDTNFYLWIKVSNEYQVIEPKTKGSNVKAEKVKETKEVEAVTVEGLDIVDYSEKAIAVFGDTKAIKDQLKVLGGRFNPSLNYNGEKRAGWIFSKKQANKVKELITPTELPELTEDEPVKKTLDKPSIWDNLKTLDYVLYDDYKAGLLTLEECARKFAKNGWTDFVDIEHTKAIFERIEQQKDNISLIIEDFAKYDSFDYPTTAEELDGFKLGEVAYDQCGEIGVILALNKKNGTARLNSNGCCDVGRLKKCPKEVAEREVKHMDIIRPGKALDSYTIEAYEHSQKSQEKKIYRRTVGNMGVVAYFTHEEDFIPRGEYKATDLDRQKQQADILLQAIDGNWYSLYLNKPIDINPGRSVKVYGEKNIAVTKSVYNRLSQQYKVMSDF